MRATAQVFKTAFAVQRHILVARDAGNDLCLVQLAQALEIGHRLVTRQHAALHRLVLGGQLGHALFDGGQVFQRERALVREVVEKAVLDHRADRDLGFREQLLHGVGQQVGGGMADQVQAFGVLGGDDGQRAVSLDQITGINDALAHFAGQSGLGQASADRGSHFGHRHRAGKFALGTVGKRDVNHGMQFGKDKEKARNLPRSVNQKR